nr:beta-propeller domain-containing protein [uncultured Blautia sp.]
MSSREDKNALYVLNMNLETVGSISDIAPGEEIKSARFFGRYRLFCDL